MIVKAGTKRAAEVAKVTAPPLDEICTARVTPVTAFAVGAVTNVAPPTRLPLPFASEPRLAAAMLPGASFRGSHRSRKEPLKSCSCDAVAVLEAVAEREMEVEALCVLVAVAVSDDLLDAECVGKAEDVAVGEADGELDCVPELVGEAVADFDGEAVAVGELEGRGVADAIGEGLASDGASAAGDTDGDGVGDGDGDDAPEPVGGTLKGSCERSPTSDAESARP
jgi:hypothetical protein